MEEYNCSRTRITDSKQKIILENLFYLLCGLDTTYIKVGIKDKRYALLTEMGCPVSLVTPFESLAINIRIFNKFILRSQYCSDSIKRLISDVLEIKVKSFLETVVELRISIKDIETLAVKLEKHAQEFEEIRLLIENIKELNGVETVNLLKNRRDETVHFVNLYEEIIDKCTKKITDETVDWITKGLILGSDFMIKANKTVNGFNESLWTHKYVILKEKIPYFLYNDKEEIYNCGRVINIGRQILKEDVFDETANVFNKLGLKALNNYLNEQLYISLKKDLLNDLEILYNYVLLFNSAYYIDIFDEIGEEAYSPTDRIIPRINAIKPEWHAMGLKFKTSPVSLNEYILKILSVQSQSTYKKKLPFLQCLTIEYSPTILKYFLSPKSISELEIIFRFLFTWLSLEYYMEKYKQYKFCRLICAIIRNIRFSLYSNIKEIEIKENVGLIIESLNNNIKKMLRDCLLTNERVYCVIASLFDICFEFLNIEYKNMLSDGEIKMFEQALSCIIARLKNELSLSDFDHLFVSFLEGIDWNRMF